MTRRKITSICQSNSLPLHRPSLWFVNHFKLLTWYYCNPMWQVMCRLVAWGRTCGQCERRLPQLPQPRHNDMVGGWNDHKCGQNTVTIHVSVAKTVHVWASNIIENQPGMFINFSGLLNCSGHAVTRKIDSSQGPCLLFSSWTTIHVNTVDGYTKSE